MILVLYLTSHYQTQDLEFFVCSVLGVLTAFHFTFRSVIHFELVLDTIGFSILAIPECVVITQCVLIYISLTINDSTHLFCCLFFIYMSSLVKCMFKCFCFFIKLRDIQNTFPCFPKVDQDVLISLLPGYCLWAYNEKYSFTSMLTYFRLKKWNGASWM